MINLYRKISKERSASDSRNVRKEANSVDRAQREVKVHHQEKLVVRNLK